MATKVETIRAKWIAKQIGPQQVGGVYESGYWRKRYRVDAITPSEDGTVWFDVTWLDDGHKGRHCTAWDRRDKVVTQP